MGIWLTYCCLCGGPPESEYDPKVRMKGTSWLKVIGGILPSDKYAFGKYDTTGEIDMGSYYISTDRIAFVPDDKPIKKGFLVHKECYNLAKNVKNLHAKLSSFNHNHHKISGYLSGLNYTPLEKYAGQFFDWVKFKNNPKDHYALENPKFNEKNRKRIMENVKKVDKKAIKPQKEEKSPRDKRIEMRVKGYSFSRKTGKWERVKSKSTYKRRKIKSSSKRRRRRSKSTSKRKRRSKSTSKRRKLSKSNKAKRKSPIESATSYAVGTKKIGLDGNVWKIKKNIRGIKRWVKL